MRTVGSFEAKTHFSKLLTEVIRGDKILITKNGKTVAMLIPAGPPPEFSKMDTLKRLRKLREKLATHKVTHRQIQLMKNEGRK